MFEKRRKKLMDTLPSQCITLLFSGKAPYKVGDEKYEFSVDRNFYYLTGLDKENMILAICKTGDITKEMLFIEEYDETQAKWVGGRMLPDEASEVSGITEIYWVNETMEVLGNLLNRMYDHEERVQLLADFTKQEPFQEDKESFKFCRELLAQYPYIELKNIANKMTHLRLIKDDMEIEQLKEAIEVTNEGILQMMRCVEPEMGEHQIEACFDFVLKSNDCKHSFPSIVASGVNATILHYSDNNQFTEENDLVLCDLGAAYEYMNADITRTFPVNGKFTERQRQIYDIVLTANQYIMSLVKPGQTLRGLNNELIRFYEKELGKIGLLEGHTVQDYYWHGVSHMLGLETHDVSLSNYLLEPGNVLTIEPGLYLEEEGIGIRIEDDVLVTKDGCINLSKDIIKEADDIETFMQNAKLGE